MSERAFECRICGQCCYGEGGIVVSEKDQERLSLFMNLSLHEFQKTYTDNYKDKRVLKTIKEGCCIFFDQTKGCRVHSHKPDLCRAWPFFRGNLQDELSWKMAQDLCPGLNPRVTHGEFIRQGIEYLRQQGLIQKARSGTAKALVNESHLETLQNIS